MFAISVVDIYVWILIFLIVLFPLYGLWIFISRHIHIKHKHRTNKSKSDFRNVDVNLFAHAHHQNEHAHHFKEEDKWYKSRWLTRVLPLTLVFFVLLWLLIAMIQANGDRLSIGPIERLINFQSEKNKEKIAKEEKSKSQSNPVSISPAAPLRYGDIGYISKLKAANNLTEAEAALDGFLGYYALDMQLKNIPKTTYEKQGQFKFTRPSSKHLSAIKTYGSMFIDEWAKYPQNFISASKLRSVAFVVGLKVDYGNGFRS